MKSSIGGARKHRRLLVVGAIALALICLLAGCSKPSAEGVRMPDEVAKDYVTGVVEGDATKVGDATGRTWLDEEVADEGLRLFGLNAPGRVVSLAATVGSQSEDSRSEPREEYVLCRVRTEPISSFETTQEPVFVSVRLRLTGGNWRVIEVPTPSMIQ